MLVNFYFADERREHGNIGIFNGHPYCLLGVTEKEGKKYVILQNPHGGIQLPKQWTWREMLSGNSVPEFKSLSDIETKGKRIREFVMLLDKFYDLYPGVTYFSSKQAVKKTLEKGEEPK